MVPIKRCPCCNQCTEALGPICYYINLELMEHTQHKYTHLHPNTFLPTVLTLSGRPLNSRTRACMHARVHLTNTHTAGKEASQPGPQQNTTHTVYYTSKSNEMLSVSTFLSCFSFLCPHISDLSCCQKVL